MHPEIDRYAHLASPIHSWDPALKIFGFGVMILALAFLTRLETAVVGLALSLAVLLVSRISLFFVLGRLKWLMMFLIPFFLLLPIEWSVSGGGFSWNWGREKLALVLSVRALAIAVLVFPMWGTAPFHLSMKSMQDLGIPKNLIQAFLFTYRYLFVYLDQLRKMRIAMKSRGFRDGISARAFKVYGNMVGMLLFTSFEQTERILNAMKSRGYDGRIRTLYQPKRRKSDWVKAAAAVFVSMGLLWGDHLWAA